MSPKELFELNKRLIEYLIENDKEGLGVLFPIEQVVDNGVLSSFYKVNKEQDLIEESKFKYAPIVTNDFSRSTIAGVSPNLALDSLLEDLYRTISLYRLMSITDNLAYTPEGFLEENSVDQEVPIIEIPEDSLHEFFRDNQDSLKVVLTKMDKFELLESIVEDLNIEDITLLPVNVEEEVWKDTDSNIVVLKKSAPIGITKILRRLDDEGNLVPIVDVTNQPHGMKRLSIRLEFLPYIQLVSNIYKVKII